MRRPLLLATLLLLGCGGGGAASSDDGTVSLTFSDEADFAPSSFGLYAYDRLEGSSENGDLDVVLESGARTLEVFLPSGSTTDLASDLNASVTLHDAFGEAQGVEGTVTVLRNDDDRISIRLDGVVLEDADGAGEATLDGSIDVENIVAARHRPKPSGRRKP